jgi:hypothetical protein
MTSQRDTPDNSFAPKRRHRPCSNSLGMIAGIADAGQVNDLGTLNICGERSVTCLGDFDRHPSKGHSRSARPRSVDTKYLPIFTIVPISRTR